jgi:hypothetical protein
MSKPPADAVIIMASAALVPVEERTREESVAPARAIVRSSAAPSDVRVKLDAAPIASRDIAPPVAVSRRKPLTPKLKSPPLALA